MTVLPASDHPDVRDGSDAARVSFSFMAAAAGKILWLFVFRSEF